MEYLRLYNPVRTILLAVVLFSCIREENIELENKEPRQLALYSIISPSNDSIKVMVLKTIPVNSDPLAVHDSNKSHVFNAEVMLSSDNGKRTQLNLLKNVNFNERPLPVYGIDQNNYQIKPGTTYHLSVATPDGLNANATTTVPDTLAKWDTIQYLGIHEDASEKSHRYLGSWIELKDSDFGYKIVEEPFPKQQYQDCYDEKETHYKVNNKGYYGNDLEFYYKKPDYKINYNKLKLQLFTITSHLKKFSAAQNVYSENEEALSSGNFLNLFKGVFPEYSNVNNGLGIFGSYRMHADSIHFPSTQ